MSQLVVRLCLRHRREQALAPPSRRRPSEWGSPRWAPGRPVSRTAEASVFSLAHGNPRDVAERTQLSAGWGAKGDAAALLSPSESASWSSAAPQVLDG